MKKHLIYWDSGSFPVRNKYMYINTSIVTEVRDGDVSIFFFHFSMLTNIPALNSWHSSMDS